MSNRWLNFTVVIYIIVNMLLPVAHTTSRYKNFSSLKPLLAYAKMSQTSTRKNINFLPPLGIEEKRSIENKENPMEIES